MTYEERTRLVREEFHPAIGAPESTVGAHVLDEHRVAVARPSGSTVASRVVVVVFGIIQALIGLRILLLLFDAREGNALVASILDLSQIFVAPFEGIFATNALQSGGAVLDVAALAAFAGWTIVELLILAVLRIARPTEEV